MLIAHSCSQSLFYLLCLLNTRVIHHYPHIISISCVLVTGFQLRKVEERIQSEKKTTERAMDVQAIMEAAFERRRRAIEENDSDGDDDVDNTWDDDDERQ